VNKVVICEGDDLSGADIYRQSWVKAFDFSRAGKDKHSGVRLLLTSNEQDKYGQ
jgi:hypothetical protein